MKMKLLVAIALLFCYNASQAESLLTHNETRKYAFGISIGSGGGGLSIYNREHAIELSTTAYTSFYHNYPDVNAESADNHLHIRRFVKPELNGWYYGAFIHKSKLYGKLKDKAKNAKQTKTGAGLEFGYTAFNLFNFPRLHLSSGLGISYYIGAKETDIFKDNRLKNDSNIGYFLDFIRIGFIF